jgi:uncharacterized protein DUF3455
MRAIPLFILAAGSSSAIAGTVLPAALNVASNEELFLEARAAGVQIYECVPKPGDAYAYAWTLRAPEATLTDASGNAIGKHYAGPTWESIDASRVVGEVKARDAGPDASAIPWLLMSAKSTSGSGVFEGTKSIQRVGTVGGLAPSSPCAASNAAQVARVPYTASYLFFRAKSGY